MRATAAALMIVAAPATAAVAAPAEGPAEGRLTLRANVTAACWLESATTTEDRSEVALRVACNTEAFRLNVRGADSAVAVAMASAPTAEFHLDGAGASVRAVRIGYHDVRLTLAEPLASGEGLRVQLAPL